MIFISYRRDDSISVVGRLYDGLLDHVPAEKVFRDLDSLFPGDEFPVVIRKKLSEPSIALVVIGPTWLDILHARKVEPVDYVRDEVRLALESDNCVVVPITVANAQMPTEIDLAEFPDLQPLALRSGTAVRPDPDFERDLRDLVGQLSRIPGSPLTTVAEVQDFLGRLALNGLKENVVYLPPKLKPDEGETDKPESLATVDDLVNFCLPVRVVDEQEWQRLEQQRSSPSRSPVRHSGNDRDYIFATSEEFLRMDGERRAMPRPLEPVFASSRRVVLRGEPGEGKTTSLYLHVAHRCHELTEGLYRRKFGLFSPQCRVPLPLPLSTAAPTKEDEPFCAVRRAQHEALRLAYKQVENAPPGVTQWLTVKVSRGEIDLCLDALDELDIRWHEQLRKELERNESATLKPEAQVKDSSSANDGVSRSHVQSEIGIFLTTRLSADDTKVIRNARRYRMVCFGTAQVRDYITRYFSHVENGEQLARELRDQLRLSPGPRHLAQIPLLLALLCEWLSSRWQWPIEKIRQEIPKTRTRLLGDALHRLMERGDARRNNPIADPPSQRNQIKEAVLRHVAWRFFATGPLPIVKHDLMPVLEQQLERPKWKGYAPPQNAEALLEEYLQDGVFVRQDQGVYRFVLRSLHEYCLAGWIARESRLVNEGDPEEFTAMIRGRSMEWSRLDWPNIKPLNLSSWETVWPLAGGQLGIRSNWLVEAVNREKVEKEDVLDSRLLLCGQIAVECDVEPEFRTRLFDELVTLLPERLLEDNGWTSLSHAHIWDGVPQLLSILDEQRGRTIIKEWMTEEFTDEPRKGEPRKGFGPQEFYLSCLSALGRIDPDFVPTLLQGPLHHDDGKLGMVLSQIDSKPFLDALLQEIQRPTQTGNHYFRMCVEALVQAGDHIAIERVAEGIVNEEYDKSAQLMCAVALSKTGDSRACALAVEWLGIPVEDANYYLDCCLILENIAAFGHASPRDFLIDILRSGKSPYPNYVASALNGIDDHASRDALRSTGFRRMIGDDDACTELIAVLTDSSQEPHRRIEVISALSGYPLTATLRDALWYVYSENDVSPRLQHYCAERLAEVGDTRITQHMIEQLDDPLDARDNPAMYLAMLGTDLCREALYTRAMNPGHRECRECLVALFDCTIDPETVQRLVARLPDVEPRTWSQFHEAISRFQMRTGWRVLTTGVLDGPE